MVQISFGVLIYLNGELADVSMDDITHLAEKGLDVALPRPVEIGSVDDLVKFLKSHGIDVPQDNALPSELQGIIGKLKSAVLSVNRLEIKIPPSGSKENKTYRLEFSVELPEAQDIIPQHLQFKGLTFGIQNTDAGDNSQGG